MSDRHRNTHYLLSYLCFSFPDEAVDHLVRLLCGRDGPAQDAPQNDGVCLTLEEAGEWRLVMGRWTLELTGGRWDQLLALTMAHSVFNRRFTKRVRAICMFVQKVVLGIDDGSKVPAAVSKLCHGLM